LSNAIFDDITVADNANDAGYPHGAGLDINLKWSDFSNIVIKNSTFTNNGVGSENGVGLTVKARDDGSYASPSASLTEVLITNSTFSGNERHLFFGEPGTNNAGPSAVVVSFNTFTGAKTAGLENNTQAVVNAARNYWGAADGPSGEGFGSGDSISEKVNFIPFFVDAALTDLSYGGDQEEVAIIADEVIEEGDEVVITGTMNI